jgi:DNA primase
MSIVEELESSTDIVELVSRYTSLKKAGVNYKALCPFA